MLVGRRWKLLLSVTNNLALCYDLILFVILSATPISSAILHPYHHHPLKSRPLMRYYSSQQNFAFSLGDVTPSSHRAAVIANSKLEKRYSALAANILMLRSPPHPSHQLRHNNNNNVMFTNSRVEATSVYTDNNSLIRRRHRKRNVDVSSLETDSDVLYASAERTCSHFRSKEVLLCNGHDRAYKCVCKASFSRDSQIITQESNDDGMHHFRRQVPYCDRPSVLPYLNNAAENILTIGVGFPVPEEFLRHPDEIFAEDIEIFAFIKMETVVIYRKGCNADESAFEFQFGILHENYSSNSGDVTHTTRRRLRTLSPEIFLNNPIFMKQQGLNIKYVKYTDNLRPIFDNKQEALAPRPRKRKSIDFSSGVDDRFLLTRKRSLEAIELTRLSEKESWRNSFPAGLMATSLTFLLILLGLCCSCLYHLFSRKHCSQTHLRV